MTERFFNVVSVYLTQFQTTVHFHANIDAYNKNTQTGSVILKFTSDKYLLMMLNFAHYENQ